MHLALESLLLFNDQSGNKDDKMLTFVACASSMGKMSQCPVFVVCSIVPFGMCTALHACLKGGVRCVIFCLM